MAEYSENERQRVVLRAQSGWWIGGLVAVIFVFFVVDAVVRGALPFALQSLPWMLLILWAIYLLLVRPAIILVPGEIEVVNVLRRHIIPWSDVEHVGSRYQVVVYLLDGRRFVSWGAPTSGLAKARPSQVAAMPTRGLRVTNGRARRASEPGTHEIVETVMRDWADWPTKPRVEKPTSGWDRIALLVLAVIVVLCVIDAVVSALVS
jgi:hypothetical protein